MANEYDTDEETEECDDVNVTLDGVKSNNVKINGAEGNIVGSGIPVTVLAFAVNAKNIRPGNIKKLTTTTLLEDPVTFDKKMKTEFLRAFNEKSRSGEIDKTEEDCEMVIKIDAKVKAWKHTFENGAYVNSCRIWVKNPAFIVEGGVAQHYDYKNSITSEENRVSTSEGGPQTNYNPANFSYKFVNFK
uniref:Uncharacterized protein n=1 Tax=Panagrolaimus davidi TaxID=227884 RepID=A0A914PBY2_9BILA